MKKYRFKNKKKISKKKIFIMAGVLLITLTTLRICRNFSSDSKVNKVYGEKKDSINNKSYSSNENNIKNGDKPLVVIDPGHGGVDPGTSGNGLVEKEVSLDLCKKIESSLKKSGINTYMIRDDDKTIDYRERIKIANTKNAALYLSIHCDNFKDTSTNGFEVFYSRATDLKKGNLLEKDYAKIMENSLINVPEIKSRGIYPNATYSVLVRAQMPSIIFEMGFLSNKNDADQLKSQSYKLRAAEALSQGIQKSLEKMKE